METYADSKYRNFVFTMQENDSGELIPEHSLVMFLHERFEDYAFQLEIGEKAKKRHYQGVLRCRYRMRKRTLLKEFESVFTPYTMKHLTVQPMIGKWEESLAYVQKTETSIGPVFMSPKLHTYNGSDLAVFDDPYRWHPWQITMRDILYESFPMMHKPAPDRQIIWLQDIMGSSGKSKFTKYVCFKDATAAKVAFGSSNQMRSSLIAAGPKRIYFIDIPRTMGKDDDIDSVISVIEDLKNGFVTSAMYGKSVTLMMDTPHIVIFSNGSCPLGKMSRDRWVSYYLDRDTFNMNRNT
jgi:hypothetical protein